MIVVECLRRNFRQARQGAFEGLELLRRGPFCAPKVRVAPCGPRRGLVTSQAAVMRGNERSSGGSMRERSTKVEPGR